MTERNHTPGPWMIDEDVRPGMSWNRHIVWNEEDSKRSLTVCFMAHSKSSGRDEANARLVSSAPDLLAACDAVLACDTHHDEKGHAYLRVPARSLNDLAAQIRAVVDYVDGI